MIASHCDCPPFRRDGGWATIYITGRALSAASQGATAAHVRAHTATVQPQARAIRKRTISAKSVGREI
jgi:hypothetical protein